MFGCVVIGESLDVTGSESTVDSTSPDGYETVVGSSTISGTFFKLIVHSVGIVYDFEVIFKSSHIMVSLVGDEAQFGGLDFLDIISSSRDVEILLFSLRGNFPTRLPRSNVSIDNLTGSLSRIRFIFPAAAPVFTP